MKLVQQRTAQMEVEDQRRQVQELTTAKKQLQAEVNSLKERLDAEILAKNDEISESWSISSTGVSAHASSSHQAQSPSSPPRTRDHFFLYSYHSLWWV